MSKTLEFFFDYGSPATYLAYTQVPALAARTGAEVVPRPFLLGGVFKATGNASPVMVPAKGKYMKELDLMRFARRYGVAMSFPPNFPVNTLPLMRGAVVAEEEGCLERYSQAVFTAMWVEARDMADAEVVAEALAAHDLDAGHLLARIAEQGVKDKLIAYTEEAVSRGAFGAPTFFVEGEMFFGQDRLDFVEEALLA